MLTAGTNVWLARSGRSYHVGKLLGEGSQGSVYELVRADGAAGRLALKWYFPVASTPRQRGVITELVRRGAPSPKFLWPLEIVESSDTEFGYVMPLRQERFAALADLLVGRVDVPLGTVVRLCLGLSHSFLSLHAQGLCYRDISFGNVFFDPASGDPLICDNDNVGVDGESESAVLGTPRFMAPEIVRGEAMPSTQTDLYSLAVLIFYILLVHHPLLGRRELAYPCLDRAADETLFGTDPVFIFDESDTSNAPDPVEHASVIENWSLLPEFVRARFRQAFGPGLRDPQARVRESVWRATLSRLLDGITTCSTCGKENFSSDGEVASCWACRGDLEAPLRLVFDDRTLVLSERSRVYRHHLVRDYDYSTTVGEIVKHPERDLWGLLNVSTTTWGIQAPGREAALVPPGKAMSLIPGTRVDFGEARARLEA